MGNKMFLKIKNFFQSQNRQNLFKLCIPALILVAVFTVVSFFPMYFGVRANTENSNKLIINTAIKSLNDIFMNIDDVYKTVESAIEGETLYGENGIITLDGVYSSHIIKAISTNLAINNFIEEIVILKKGEDLVLTTGGVMQKKDFFGKNYASETYGANFFDNIATDYQNVKVIPSASYKNMEKYPAEDPKSLLACVKRYDGNNVNIIIFISRDQFIKTANLAPLENNINFKIYDYNDSVIYSNSDSEYMINTTNVSGDFDEQVINLAIKKYYIKKSDYNYFYYVAEVNDTLLVMLVASILLLAAGFILGIIYLMKGINNVDGKIVPIFTELGIAENEGNIEDIKGRIKEYKEEINENALKLNTMSDEIKSSIFLKTVTSSSFYGRYKKTVDALFNDILNDKFFFILSFETIRENIKTPKYELEKTKNYLDENSINYIYVEEKTRKHLYIIGCDKDESQNIINGLKAVIKDVRQNNMEVLACYSREFDNIGNLYDAFRDIRICRDYRGIDDKTSFLSTESIAYGNHIYLPPNFKEELTGKIMAKEEVETKKYIKDIFAENIKNNIPLSKFEFMLRQMLNTLIDALSMNRKNNSDMYELEQVFLAGIEQLKENHDVYGIINNFINLVHLSINMYDNKKSTLNRADVIKYITSNYNKDIYLEKIAAEFNTTPKYFSNYFKKEFTVGFSEYVTGLRISQAKKLLSETDKTLSDISEDVGYLSQATFAAAFKKITGLPPGKYREINKTSK